MKLVKSSFDKVLFGVCGGIAKYLNLDSTIVRIVFVIASVFGVGSPVLIYVILALIMPNEY
ncbi:PspC domain-containing protein [Rapidithrix thailandica]|uniref:PspC domain-containing protein n=1 Tax=Rapidithrix thailandica TaxID=413964 RepID=A0AAW9S9C3_9BACT